MCTSSCKAEENEVLGLRFSSLNADTMGVLDSYSFRKVHISSNLVSSHMLLDTSVYATKSLIRLFHVAVHYDTFFIRL